MWQSYSAKSFNESRLKGTVARLQGDEFKGWAFELELTGARRLKDAAAIEKMNSVRLAEVYSIGLIFSKDEAEVRIEIHKSGDVVYLGCTSKPEGTASEERLTRFAAELLALTPASEDELETTLSTYDMNYRVVRVLRIVERLEARQLGSSLGGAKVFLSYHFDDDGAAAAREIKDFLTEIGTAVVDGTGYEPRAVSQKVMDRLKSGCSLFIVIFTRADRLAWLQQEIGAAAASSIPIMVLLRDDVNVDLGMLKGTEYVKFPANAPSKTFIHIVQAVKYCLTQREK